MKALFGWMLLACSVALFAAPPSEIDVVKERAALNSAKADLEEARKKRDMAVAARWKDREAANQERELFNEKYKENKEKVEALMLERARLQEDVRVGREDLSQMRAAMETARAEYLALTAGPERLTALQQIGEQGVPFKMPERLERFNRLKKDMELYRDDPMKIAQGIFDLAKEELEFSRAIEREEAELVFGSTVASGSRLRLGGIYAMQAANQGPVAIMLAQVGAKKRSFAWQENLTPEVREQVAQALAKKDSVMLVPVDVLLSTALSSEIANYAEKDFTDEAKEFFRDGGVLMYPILALFLIGLFVSVHRLSVILWKGRSGNASKVLKALKDGDFSTAKSLASGMKGSLGNVISCVLNKNHPNRESAEKALEEVFAQETPSLEKGLSTISVMATTAPLLGLLGTVMGMIQLFEVITLHGTSDPKLLAGGISVALVTTEAGLMVAIPLQLLHTFLSNRADRLTAKLESAGLAVLNAFFGSK